MRHLSVVVHDLNVVGITAPPGEADAPLVIDTTTVLTPAVALERLKLIARRGFQIFKNASPVEIEQLSPRGPRDCLESPNRHVPEQRLCVLAPEGPDHLRRLLRITSYVKPSRALEWGAQGGPPARQRVLSQLGHGVLDVDDDRATGPWKARLYGIGLGS